MPWKWCFQSCKLLLFWYIMKCTFEENWPLQVFCFGVILMAISCRFSYRKMVGFDWIGFFWLGFKKPFLSFRQRHHDSDLLFATTHNKPNILSCVNNLWQKSAIFEIYIKFCIFRVQGNAFCTNIYYLNTFKIFLKKLAN